MASNVQSQKRFERNFIPLAENRKENYKEKFQNYLESGLKELLTQQKEEKEKIDQQGTIDIVLDSNLLALEKRIEDLKSRKEKRNLKKQGLLKNTSRQPNIKRIPPKLRKDFSNDPRNSSSDLDFSQTKSQKRILPSVLNRVPSRNKEPHAAYQLNNSRLSLPPLNNQSIEANKDVPQLSPEPSKAQLEEQSTPKLSSTAKLSPLPLIKRKKEKQPEILSGKRQKYSYFCKLPRESEDMKQIFKRMYVEQDEKPSESYGQTEDKLKQDRSMSPSKFAVKEQFGRTIMQKFDQRLNKFEKAIEERRKKTKEIELARLEREKGEPEDLTKKSIKKKSPPRISQKTEVAQWDQNRKDKMKKLENMRVDRHMFRNFLFTKYQPPQLAQKLANLFEMCNQSGHSKLTYDRYCDMIDIFAQNDHKMHLQFAFNCLSMNSNGRYIQESDLFDIMHNNEEPMFMKAFYTDYKRIVAYAMKNKAGMDEKKIQLSKEVKKKKAKQPLNQDMSSYRKKKASLQIAKQQESAYPADSRQVEKAVREKQQVPLRLKLDFNDFIQIDWGMQGESQNITPAFFDDFLLTIGAIRRNKNFNLEEHHKRMSSKIARSAEYAYFKKTVYLTIYEKFMKSFRVLANAPSNLTDDEVEISCSVSQEKMIDNFEKVFGLKCDYIAKRFYFILSEEVPDRQINMQLYYNALYPLMQNIHEQDMDFIFKIFSSTGWVNSTDLLDFQNDIDQEKYPDLAKEIQKIINQFTQVIFTNRYKRVDQICDVNFLNRVFHDKPSQLIQIFKDGVNLKYTKKLRSMRTLKGVMNAALFDVRLSLKAKQ